MAATSLMLDYDKVKDSSSRQLVVDPSLRARRVAERDIILHGIYAGTDEAGQGQDKPWSYRCRGDDCAITTEIRNDDGPSEVAMHLDVVVDRRVKALKAISLRFPPAARGKTLAFAFSQAGSDPAGAALEPNSTRTFVIADCDSRECRVTLPKGLVPAAQHREAMDVGAADHGQRPDAHQLPKRKRPLSDGDRALGLQARERQLASAGTP